MQEALRQMLERYDLRSADGAVHALREIVQEIVLLGLWRAKFFEHAAFYGGTALRILHGLDRFSEDLDFTLLKPNPDFDLGRFIAALSAELRGFGFEVEIRVREKKVDTRIQSAFLKGNTRRHLLVIGMPEQIVGSIHRDQILRVKLEVDTDPPPGFSTATRYLLQPLPFAVRACELPDLFAGKMHALLFRRWKNRVKGRDWYDFVWLAGRHPRLNLSHLEQRMRQTGDWDHDEALAPEILRELLDEAIGNLDLDQARSEVRPFRKHPESLELWSCDFFREVAARIEF